MTAATVKVSSLVTTPVTTSTVNSKSEPLEVLDYSRQYSATLSEVVSALSHVPLPTATNTTSAAGYPGEVISSAVLVANTAAITTATPANITSIELTPGSWAVSGNFSAVLAAATVTAIKTSTGTTTATHGLAQHSTDLSPNTTTATGTLSSTVPTRFIQVAAGATQVVYLVITGTFSAGAVTAHGSLSAVRIS
jgi:hypothetical protein